MLWPIQKLKAQRFHLKKEYKKKKKKNTNSLVTSLASLPFLLVILRHSIELFNCDKGPVKLHIRNKEHFSDVSFENSILQRSVDMQHQCIDQVFTYKKSLKYHRGFAWFNVVCF